MATKTYDAKGLHCPLPLMQVKKDLKLMGPDDTLEVLSTDPYSVKNFDTFCRMSGHELVESDVNDGIYRFLLRRGAA